MLELLETLLNSRGYIPHGHCYLWKSQLVWLHVASNAAIALAYFSIPILLIYFISRRKDIPFNGVFILFSAFIIACGSGHLMDIWTIWHPTYWLAGLLKAATAIISLYTALALISLIPQALALPSPAQLEITNQELQETVKKLHQTQSQLVQTEKMSSLGHLVAGIAHEINNPVNFIYGNLIHINNHAQALMVLLHVYQKAYPQPVSIVQDALKNSDLEFIEDDLPRILESIRSGADRIQKIVSSLRNFSRLDEAEMKPVNIHDGIDSTLLILQSRLQNQSGCGSIQVLREYGNIPMVDCYAGELNQVFMSILCNAIDALETCKEEQASHANGSTFSQDVDTVNPTLANSSSDDSDTPHLNTITIQTQLIDQHNVAIKITDNSTGIEPTIKQKIFNAFFTTKPVGQGIGLGLYTSHQIIVEKHGGQLECVSEPGQGTTFLIKIPVRQSVSISNSASKQTYLRSR